MNKPLVPGTGIRATVAIPNPAGTAEPEGGASQGSFLVCLLDVTGAPELRGLYGRLASPVSLFPTELGGGVAARHIVPSSTSMGLSAWHIGPGVLSLAIIKGSALSPNQSEPCANRHAPARCRMPPTVFHSPNRRLSSPRRRRNEAALDRAHQIQLGAHPLEILAFSAIPTNLAAGHRHPRP